MTAGVLNAAAHPDEPGARRVFLTAIGGGVFGNDMMWVQDAMKRAFDKFKGYNLEVTLVSYGRQTPEFRPLLAAFGGTTDSEAESGEVGVGEVGGRRGPVPETSQAKARVLAAKEARDKERAEKVKAMSKAKAGQDFLFPASKLGEGDNAGFLQDRLKEEGF